MADAPWRCSQCGTVNAPAANSCRTCGRWPSLFELEAGAVGNEPVAEEEEAFPEERYAEEPEPYVEEPEPYREEQRRETTHPPVEPEPTETAPRPEHAPWPGPEPSIPQTSSGRSLRRLSRLVIPLLIVIYVIVSAARGR